MELTIQDILEDLHAAENKCQEFEKNIASDRNSFSMPIPIAGLLIMAIQISPNGLASTKASWIEKSAIER